MTKILIVDDDEKLCEKVAIYLSSKEFEVIAFSSAEGVCDEIQSKEIDLVILDVNMPKVDGFELAKMIREFSAIPILFYSASTDEVDKIVGLEIGGDDFVSKPVNPRELLARIQAILRRYQSLSSQSMKSKSGLKTFAFGEFEFFSDSFRLLKGGEDVDISTGELSLLKVFCENPELVLSREQILDKLNVDIESSFDRSIDVRINRLRKKIEENPSKPVFIKTVRGQGYIFSFKV